MCVRMHTRGHRMELLGRLQQRHLLRREAVFLQQFPSLTVQHLVGWFPGVTERPVCFHASAGSAAGVRALGLMSRVLPHLLGGSCDMILI